MDTVLMLDQLISALESSHALLLHQAATFQSNRASLELSFLTEEILPVPELQKILRFTRRGGHNPDGTTYLVLRTYNRSGRMTTAWSFCR